MIKRITLVLVLLALPLTTTAAFTAVNPLKPFHAEYIVDRNGNTVAQASTSLIPDGKNRWVFTNSVKPIGWIASILSTSFEEQSTWMWTNGIKALSYRYDRSDKEKHVSLIFDWQQMRVTNIIDGDSWRMKIPHATQDKASIYLALSAHMSVSETNTSFPVADGGKLKTYDFKIIGEGTINTPLGKINTINISKNKRGRKKQRKTTLWLAPDFGYLLVRMEKTDKDGNIITMKIQSLNQ